MSAARPDMLCGRTGSVAAPGRTFKRLANGLLINALQDFANCGIVELGNVFKI